MASMIELDNTEWALVEDLFDPPGREGARARYPRRKIVDAILFLARTGCQWRYLPACYPPWEAVWQQWRRWRNSGVWAKAMSWIARRSGLLQLGADQCEASTSGGDPRAHRSRQSEHPSVRPETTTTAGDTMA